MMRVLVVDDHILFQEGIASLLNKQPDLTVVGGAGSVKEAITKSLCLQPDVVLMDFSLPDGTGLEATQAILAQRPSTKIVFLTIHEDDERLFQAIRCGARGYLLKNTPVDQLLAYLRGLGNDEVALSPASISRILEEFAQSPVHEASEPEIAAQLTARQIEVLRELRRGATNREIANNLFISEQTVKNHISHILSTLKLNSRYEAASFARRYNL
ncbi:MAG: response regulator transcription factor [Chloroflexi bacterium]|nr:response regulator transcription factor [Chloroflexota bacterium]